MMDSHAGPNLRICPPAVTSLRPAALGFLDVHLMAASPKLYAESLGEAGANQLRFQLEGTTAIVEFIYKIHKAELRTSIARRPKTSVEIVFPLLAMIKMVIVMAGKSYFSRQEFMPDMTAKVELLAEQKSILEIQIDRQLNVETIETAAKAVVTSIAAGAIFRATAPQEMIAHMRQSVEQSMVAHRSITRSIHPFVHWFILKDTIVIIVLVISRIRRSSWSSDMIRG
jgi:ribulose-phosphate 3-epimerase